MGLGIAALESADRFEDLVAFFQPALVDAVLEFLEALGEGPALAAAHGPFLAAAWLAAGQQIVDLATLEEFDFDFGVVGQTLPAASALQVRLEIGQGVSGAWTADNVGPVG